MNRILAGIGIVAASALGTSAAPGTPALAVSTTAPPVPVSAVPSASWYPWKACPNKPADNCAAVRAITRTPSGTVLLGGDFSQLRGPGGLSRPATNLAALNDAGNPVSTFKSHGFNGTIFTLATDGTSVYVGGAFSKVDGSGTLHILRLNAADGSIPTEKSGTGSRPVFKGSINGTVYASVVANGRVYVGGKFSTVQGGARVNLAALNPITGAVDPTWLPTATLILNAPYPNDAAHNSVPVRALAASSDHSRIYIAGDMDKLNGADRPAIGAVDPVSGGTPAIPFTPKLPKPAGQLDTTSYQGMSIAVVDPSSGLTPGVILASGGLYNNAWRLNTDGSVAWQVNASGDLQAAAVMGRIVFLGGHFDCVSTGSCFAAPTTDDVRAIHIAAFDYNGIGNLRPLTDWTPELGTTKAPYYYGVWALQVYGSSLYVGGVFKNVISGGMTYPQPKYARFSPKS